MDNALPLLRKNDSEAGSTGCCICGRPRTREDEPYVRMSLGALYFYDEAFQTGGPREEMGGFWHILSYPGKGPPRELLLADDVVGGQMEYFFCSPACLRDFFERILQHFEQRQQE